VGKTGPTPAPSGDTRRRVPGPGLQRDRVVAPEASGDWRSETTQAWDLYVASEAWGLLRAEDLPAVWRLFERLDLLATMWACVPQEPDGAEKALRSIRLLDSMIARQMAELGIGPLARARLGLAGPPKESSPLDTFDQENS
jgi:hypothetical protein